MGVRATGDPADPSLVKERIRRRIWSLLEERGVSRFPKPAFGRIPNFVGAEVAALKLADQAEFEDAEVVKVNPDSPQRTVRRLVLRRGKLLIMPSPRLSRGFIILNPDRIPDRAIDRASSIRGAFNYGELCPLRSLPKVDLVVAGSVAVSKSGVRIGKGGGYSEMEYAILRELNLVGEETPIFTTVHDLQVIDEAPLEPHDLTVDAIITPTRIIRVMRRMPRPKGIIWEEITREHLMRMPILSELKRIKRSRR